MIRRIVILGASGDLTGRYLMPALGSLYQTGALPAELMVLGIAREDWSVARFRDHIASRLATHAPSLSAETKTALLQMLDYRRADVGDAGQLGTALKDVRGPSVIYLALPPSLLCDVLGALAALRVGPDTRIVVEKPFGESFHEAQALNRLLHDAFPEQNVYRIDHFLHKQTIQNILGLRFANRIFEPLWNSEHVARVDIVWDETLTLEGRAGYYDRAGALKDMVQNHLLQLLALVAMEPPRTFGERDLRDRKTDALRAVVTLDREAVRIRTRRARYRRGRIGERNVPDYADEPGVDPSRETETYAEILLNIENWRWAGVPFRLRSGKGLRSDRHEVCLTFRPVPHLAFDASDCPPLNTLRLALNPDRIVVSVNINGPGDPFDLEEAALTHTLANQDMSAYGRLLLNIMEGNPVLSIRDDEAEESWRIVEPIVASWREGAVPMLDYAAGSDGPAPPLGSPDTPRLCPGG